MTPWKLIDSDALPEGSELCLFERDGAFMIRSDGLELMTTEAVRSEEAFVGFGLECLEGAPERVLVGGLGLGFTLGEVCRRVPDAASIVVAELSGKVIEWARGPAGTCNRPFLEQPNVTVRQSDLLALLREPGETFDLILLDIDNGPEALVHPGNDRLYGEEGFAALKSRLADGGVAVFWSAIKSEAFEAQLRTSFGTVEILDYPVPQNPRIVHTFYVVPA